MTSNEIRQQFLDFFRSKGHTIVPSAPIVIKDDPTLMFTNAGMNQFKDYFLGNRKAPHKRVADTQKCLRVSGKHNDLEEVGVDSYHHTMFEMLGNWSFGDYFKKEAIEWSWELLTKVYKIPPDRLYVTVFEGDEKENLPADTEAKQEWEKWVAPDRVLLGNKKDNFWEMGDTGPCGPCTEIHMDWRPDEERNKIPGKNLVNKDDHSIIEIWNNVFIQFNRSKDGNLEPLPERHVDTGMGLERLVRILQNKRSNYDTDIFTGLISATEKITSKKYKAGDSKPDIAFRVVADHIRAISFTIVDGQLPSNTGAGYVIRRILRRAARYYFSYLDHKQPLLFLLVPVLAEQFKDVFPELPKQSDFVSRVIKEEEEAFLRTLDKGLKRMEELKQSSSGKVISGKDAFELYDTYGFPIDLTRLIAAESGLSIDEAGFGKEMEKQKERSRAATTIDAEDWIVFDEMPRNEFIGYNSLESVTKVVKYRKVRAKGRESYQVVLEVTPFYAESGGQVGDKGWLETGGSKLEVFDTKKENDLIIHYTDSVASDMSGEVMARVDRSKRNNTQVHHSATHLLHSALRKVLGSHVEQKGSLVNDEYLRFDFSHFSKMTDDEIAQVEALVNEKIRENIPVSTEVMPKEKALKMGAMALFGEKYGDRVRVVMMDPTYSFELCGGTHVSATGDLGFFKIAGETAIAAGVRRIEAYAGKMAEQYLDGKLKLLDEISEQLKNPKELKKSIETLVAENAGLKKKLEKFEAKQIVALSSDLLKKSEKINGSVFIGNIVDVSNPESLKKLGFELKGGLKNYLIVLAASIEGKAHVAVLIDENLAATKNLDAPKIIKEYIAPLIKGGGGGQKTMATAGGQETGNLDKVIEMVRSLL